MNLREYFNPLSNQYPEVCPCQEAFLFYDDSQDRDFWIFKIKKAKWFGAEKGGNIRYLHCKRTTCIGKSLKLGERDNEAFNILDSKNFMSHAEKISKEEFE